MKSDEENSYGGEIEKIYIQLVQGKTQNIEIL